MIHGANRKFVAAASLQPLKSIVFLHIAPLVIQVPDKDKPVKTFALRDYGSQTPLLKSFAKQIGLKGENSVLHLDIINPGDSLL